MKRRAVLGLQIFERRQWCLSPSDVVLFFFPQVSNRQIAGLAVESFYPQPLQANLESDGGGNVQLWDLRVK